MGVYAQDYFLALHSKLEFRLVAWQPHRDDNAPGGSFIQT